MTPIVLPKLGESITSATVIQWFKKVGDSIAVDEPLLAVSTDKVNSEIPSPIAGVVMELLVPIDTEVEVGTPLAMVATHGEIAQKTVHTPISSLECPQVAAAASSSVLSPAVLRFAQEQGIPLEQLDQVRGSGEGGRVTKKDVEQWVAQQSRSQGSLSIETQGVERIPLSPMRKAIAYHLMRSVREVPQASATIEVDLTEALHWIRRHRESWMKTEQAKLTITTRLIECLCRALQQYPLLNSTLDGDTILCKKEVHLGIAVHIAEGLMVPVLRGASQASRAHLSREVARLAAAARAETLRPDEVQGATFTLTNFGMTGALLGTPILPYPQAGILGIGTIQPRVIVLPDGSFAARDMAYLTLTFDHRIVDGIYACEFLAKVKEELERAPSE